MSNTYHYEIKEVGMFTPKICAAARLRRATWVISSQISSDRGIKDWRHVNGPAKSGARAAPGFQEIHPMVFSGIYPINTADFEHLKTALGKLRLTIRRLFINRRARSRSVSDFAADFSGCSTWKSCRSDCAANTTWTSSRPARASFIKSRQDGRNILVKSTIPRFLPDPSVIEEIREPIVKSVRALPERKHRGHDAADYGKARPS